MSYYVDIIDIDIRIRKDKLPDLERDLKAALPEYAGLSIKWILSCLHWELEPVTEWAEDENGHWLKDERGKLIPKPTDMLELTTDGSWDGRWEQEQENMFRTLAKYAENGSSVHFNGEDGCLFGYEMENGEAHYISGSIVWKRVMSL